MLANLGPDRGGASAGLLLTAAATPPGAPRQFAAEGAVLVGGAAVQWLRDGLGVIADAAESERLAREVDSTGGVTFVPALTGLGSPHWDPDARGLISGITRGTTRAHLARAALEAIAHQVADVLGVLPIGTAMLRADGGATANGFLMQLQADLIGSPVEVAADSDATALGAAALAGLAIGTWPRHRRRRVVAAPRRALRASAQERRGGRAARRLARRPCQGDAAPVTLVIAHRGASAEEKENTLPAFERAIELGADYIEFDIQASSDGALVVFHDLLLDRLTPLRGPLRARSLSELREHEIPTLEEVLELAAGRIGVMAEIKSPWLYRRHDIVARTGPAANGECGRPLLLASGDRRDTAAAARSAHDAARRLGGSIRAPPAAPGRPASTTTASPRAAWRRRSGTGSGARSTPSTSPRACSSCRNSASPGSSQTVRIWREKRWLVGQAEEARAVGREARYHLRADYERRCT